jgi:hypothetical protein
MNAGRRKPSQLAKQRKYQKLLFCHGGHKTDGWYKSKKDEAVMWGGLTILKLLVGIFGPRLITLAA